MQLRHHPRRSRNTADDDEHDDIHDERDNADVEILDGLWKRRDELAEGRLRQCHCGDGGNARKDAGDRALFGDEIVTHQATDERRKELRHEAVSH